LDLLLNQLVFKKRCFDVPYKNMQICIIIKIYAVMHYYANI